MGNPLGAIGNLFRRKKKQEHAQSMNELKGLAADSTPQKQQQVHDILSETAVPPVPTTPQIVQEPAVAPAPPTAPAVAPSAPTPPATSLPPVPNTTQTDAVSPTQSRIDPATPAQSDTVAHKMAQYHGLNDPVQPPNPAPQPAVHTDAAATAQPAESTTPDSGEPKVPERPPTLKAQQQGVFRHVSPTTDSDYSGTDTFYIDLRPRMVKIPKFKDKREINIRYPVLPPFAFVHIYWDEEAKELLYEVEEPLLSETEKEILNLLQLGLEEMINVSFVHASKYNLVLKYLERNVQSILIELGTRISKKSYQKLMYYIYRDSVGLNEIEPLLRDYYIEDIECNGTGYPIYIVHRAFENLRTNVLFIDKQKHMDFVEKLAQKCGRYVSYAKPLLDGTLPDGSRINATYTDDITTRGPTFTIRKFTKDPWTPAHLIKSETASADLYAFLWIALEEKFNMMVIGETASGKTTFMNSVVSFMPPEARICSIEDTRELNLAHLNWLPAVTREGFGIPNLMGSKYGEVTLFDLLKESFRQNPDYVIVGEVRGKEAFVLFQGMASGHPSYGTFHAGSVETLMRRLQTPPIELSPALCETLDLVVVAVHIKQGEKGIRRIKEINEIQKSYEDGTVDYNQLFKWDPITDQIVFNGNSEIFRKLALRSGRSEEELMDELARRSALLQAITDKNILDFKDFNRIIHNFYKDSEHVFQQFGIVE